MIAAMVALVQRLQRWHWRSNCGDSIGAAITAISLAQLLR
jgi:hypothetical protein